MTDLYDEMFGEVDRWDVEDVEDTEVDEVDPDDVDLIDFDLDEDDEW